MLQINFPTFCLKFKGGIKEIPNTCITYVCKGGTGSRILAFDYNTCEILITYNSDFKFETEIAISILNEFSDLGNLLILLIDSEKMYIIEEYTGVNCLKKLFVKNKNDFVGFEAMVNSLYSDYYIQELLKEENKD